MPILPCWYPEESQKWNQKIIEPYIRLKAYNLEIGELLSLFFPIGQIFDISYIFKQKAAQHWKYKEGDE